MPDPDLEIRKGGEGRGGPLSRLLDKLDEDGRRFRPIFFPPFGPQFGVKKEGRAGPPAAPLDPPLVG